MSSTRVLAAGALVWRVERGERQLLVIHRPRYDDWSLPKGKCDPGESTPVTAVREVEEETGIRVRLAVPLPTVRYRLSDGREKVVHYWVARARGADDTDSYQANREVDAVRWVGVTEARTLLSHRQDRRVLSAFVESVDLGVHKTTPLVILRHAAARSKRRWRGRDHKRTLSSEGKTEARRLAPLLDAFGIEQVITSDAARCRLTVKPFAREFAPDVHAMHGLSQEGMKRSEVVDVVDATLAAGRPTVICTHRPVLPLIWPVLGLEDPKLEPSAFVVAHQRKGVVVATEQHSAR